MSIQPSSRLRDSDRKVRIHLTFYDRTKFLLLFGITLAILTWSDMANNPIISFRDALIDTVNNRTWILVLVAIQMYDNCILDYLNFWLPTTASGRNILGS